MRRGPERGAGLRRRPGEHDNGSVTAYVDNLFDDDTIRNALSQGDFFGLFSSPGGRSWVVISPDPVRGGLRASYRF